MENKHQILKDVQKLEEKHNLLKSEAVKLKSEISKSISKYNEIRDELIEIEKEYVDKMQILL